MEETSKVIGNPFEQRYSSGKLVSVVTGSKGYRHFIYTVDEEYAFPLTFSLREDGGQWSLVEPSVVTKFAEQLRAANGGEQMEDADDQSPTGASLTSFDNSVTFISDDPRPLSGMTCL